jgi:glycogen debranching enzyme
MKNAYDPQTGLVKGESTFLDWREQTYPRWMQPVDIYESENLGTNAVHYQANRVLAQMAQVLNDVPASNKYNLNAASIKEGINTHLWMNDKGYYGQYIYGRNYKSLSPRSEALGEALTVLFGIADTQQQQSVVSHTPVTDFGISCIYPQIPGIPPYHNNAVWPFVQSYWALASAKAGNEQSVMESIAAVYRPAALFLTNKENFVVNTGDFAGTQINSSNMLWSLSGSLSLVHKVLFGIDFHPDSLVFHPFVPKALAGKQSLTNFKYRKAILNITLEGYGNQISLFELDGKVLPNAFIPCTLSGTHSIHITLANNDLSGSFRVLSCTLFLKTESNFSKQKSSRLK